MSTRRSTRRTAASAESAQTALGRASQEPSPPVEAPKKKTARKTKAAPAQAESQAVTQPASQSVVKATVTSRATSASTTTTAASVITKRKTRAAAAAAAGAGSPLRVLEQPERKRKRGPRGAASATPEPAQSEPAQENNDEPGIFFSKSEHHISSIQQTPKKTPSKVESDALRHRVSLLETRVIELEGCNAQLHRYEEDYHRLLDIHAALLNQYGSLQQQLSAPQPTSLVSFLQSRTPPVESTPQSSPTSLQRLFHISSPTMFPPRTGQVLANTETLDFDSHMLDLPETVPQGPMFVNSSESAIALLHKIENAAKEPAVVDASSVNASELRSDVEPSGRNSLQGSTSVYHNAHNATPMRAIASPSSFFGRSFSALSALGSRFFASTPRPLSTPDISSSTPIRSTPAPDTFTETLSLPPTSIGERAKASGKKRKANAMLRILLKGVELNDKPKAEEWAKRVIPGLKSDPAFREKRKRLETPVLFGDLEHFPSSKPWETGFGDPLGELGEDDVVPVWAVYLDMMAEDKEPQEKKQKRAHKETMDFDDVASLNEQFAVSESRQSSPQLHDSHGHTASLRDLHPRRSIEPSPMFDSPTPHQPHQHGENIFSELRGHDVAAENRAIDLESLQHATKTTVQTHNPGMGSFSVPDESDDEDSMITETTETTESDAAPLWTQAPPPAPVPAHAPLPGGAADGVVAQQPVDEIERQRQRLMKHTPAKPSRLREATYPSPSLLSEVGNDSLIGATPAQTVASMADVFEDMPDADIMELDDSEQENLDTIAASTDFKQNLAANPWPAPIITYESEEEDLSPI